MSFSTDHDLLIILNMQQRKLNAAQDLQSGIYIKNDVLMFIWSIKSNRM